ncbi:VOC family protein [Arthrobacter cupressi]|uniref:Methylmalonyl-CoA/ethylmalonyl-CoA epimerase n=1 Tax=Arthrobacter cupressi TaxID=1045773 RepID=A0A1G8WVE0_9MICC|nr:VOC family protein [Arthrobacter cupressi]NYD79893.1 methylmalonyl-CoA/ethylmalonyl-CoA epimerase [Arthrobacter cupressi]SDJ81595.1 methylmalonyl-CoA/ethylmalonyl-CoA epimerase [Arthrobacter cupressi]
MKIIQIAQRAVDLDRAAAFYADLLGAQPLARFDQPGLLFFDLGGVRLLLERGAPAALIYLEQSDLHAALTRLEGRGVKVVARPQLVFTHPDSTLGPAGTEEWMAFIEDSEGNTVALVSRTPAAGD